MPETPPIARPTPADLAFMPSEKIADLVLEGLAILRDRNDFPHLTVAGFVRQGSRK